MSDSEEKSYEPFMGAKLRYIRDLEKNGEQDQEPEQEQQKEKE